jgi:hypothetical protein
MAGKIRLLEHYRTDSPESKFPYVRKKSFLQSALSVLLLVFVNKMDITARYKTSKECILTRFLVWCNSSLPFAFASSKYFARRRLGSPASSIAEHETTEFTVGLIFRAGKLEQNMQASKAVCTQSSFPVLEFRRQVPERRVCTTALPPSPDATHTTSSSSRKIKVIRRKFHYLLIGETFLQEHVRESYFQAIVATQPETNTILQGVSNYDAANVLAGSRPGALQQLR